MNVYLFKDLATLAHPSIAQCVASSPPPRFTTPVLSPLLLNFVTNEDVAKVKRKTCNFNEVSRGRHSGKQAADQKWTCKTNLSQSTRLTRCSRPQAHSHTYTQTQFTHAHTCMHTAYTWMWFQSLPKKLVSTVDQRLYHVTACLRLHHQSSFGRLLALGEAADLQKDSSWRKPIYLRLAGSECSSVISARACRQGDEGIREERM